MHCHIILYTGVQLIFYIIICLQGAHYPDDIARLCHSDDHVLAEWFYCDHQSALAEYGLTPLSVLSLGGVSVCFSQPAVEKKVTAAETARNSKITKFTYSLPSQHQFTKT